MLYNCITWLDLVYGDRITVELGDLIHFHLMLEVKSGTYYGFNLVLEEGERKRQSLFIVCHIKFCKLRFAKLRGPESFCAT